MAAAPADRASPSLRNSPRCRHALADAAWESRWLPSNLPRHRYGMDAAQQVLRCCPRKSKCWSQDRCCLMYVRNPKAGSTFFYRGALGRYFPELDCVAEKKKLPLQSSLGPAAEDATAAKSSGSVTTRDFVFTVVREPITVAHSAFCEVDRRDVSPPGPVGTWVRNRRVELRAHRTRCVE
jgi:hypothetical protein